MRMHISIDVHTYTYIHTYIHKLIYIYIHIHTDIYIYVCFICHFPPDSFASFCSSAAFSRSPTSRIPERKHQIGYPCESNSCNDSGHGDDDFENGHVDDGDGDRLDDAHGRAGDRALARVCVRVIAEDGKVIVSDDDHDDDEDDGDDDDGDKLRKVMVKVAGTFLDVDRDEAKTNICV